MECLCHSGSRMPIFRDNRFLSMGGRDQSDTATLYKTRQCVNVRLFTRAEDEVNELHVGLKGKLFCAQYRRRIDDLVTAIAWPRWGVSWMGVTMWKRWSLHAA